MPSIKSEAALFRRKMKVHPSDLGSHVVRTARLNRAQRRNKRNNDSIAGSYIAHFGVHLTGDNAGDVMLYESVERLIQNGLSSPGWRKFALRQEVSALTVAELNASAEAVVVGGGGLIFPRTPEESSSGWQWNIRSSHLEMLEVPLVLFGVGVNNFRNQTNFTAEARDHLRLTYEKSAFLGLRNRGSIQRFQELVPSADPSQLAFQPCPTTVIGEFLPLRLALGDTPRVAVNVAMDRADLRFEDEGKTLSAIARACRRISDCGAQIVAVTHADNDDAILPFFEEHAVQHEVVRLERRLPEEIVDFYSSIDLTLGMRGHAQMIPFGCGGMILSLVSHDKLGFFLDDIGHPEWGIEVNEGDLDTRLADMAIDLLARKEEVLEEVRLARSYLWNLTLANLSDIRSIIRQEAVG